MALTHEIWERCERCLGSGELLVKQQDPEHPVEPTYIECPSCKGEGKRLWGGLKEV